MQNHPNLAWVVSPTKLTKVLRHTSSLVLVFFQIYIFSPEGKQVQVLLDKEKGIENPTRVRVDEEGKRLLVINKDGNEIRTYKVQTVGQKSCSQTLHNKRIPILLSVRSDIRKCLHK